MAPPKKLSAEQHAAANNHHLIPVTGSDYYDDKVTVLRGHSCQECCIFWIDQESLTTRAVLD